MSSRPVAITAIGIISPLGRGVEKTAEAIAQGLRGIHPLDLFDPGRGRLPLPVGQASLPQNGDALPRSHRLAREAARQVMAAQTAPPDAIVVGVTTGGMLTTEELLKSGVSDQSAFNTHSPGSVAACLARSLGCRGPVLTVSTACSSGAVAITLGVEMIRSGRFGRVLAGGADALCRLTYHGFNSLQIVDPRGARPLDQHRAGMSVGEGAAFVLLASDGGLMAQPIAEILGAGLSCDAYHPASPHPQGKGAFDAMTAALKAAGLAPGQIGYVNLHGTGTRENDLAEAMALHRVFGRQLPLLSSIKGATGHGLAASGAIEAVISTLAVSRGLVPGTSGLQQPDPELGLSPVVLPRRQPVSSVLSNSLGFGGNNASLVVVAPKPFGPERAPDRPKVLTIVSSACITGAGDTHATLACLARGESFRGIYPTGELSKRLNKRAVRRLRRLPRIALALAKAACDGSKKATLPSAVFFGTGWGALSETHNFLQMLFESDEQFSSPTDFIGSVHNAPAGQVALNLGATGANLTLCGGDVSFEQALAAAAFLAPTVDGNLLVMGADEYHPVLSARFDPSVTVSGPPADGGGALCLTTAEHARGPKIEPVLLGLAGSAEDSATQLIEALGGVEAVRDTVGVVLAGIPAAMRQMGSDLLRQFLGTTRYGGAVIEYRKLTGEFASASAVAAALAAQWATSGKIPGALCRGHSAVLKGKGILLIGLGEFPAAVTIRGTA